MATRLDALTPEQKAERDRQFEREALPWLDDVYRFALSLTRDDADAEDVVQETFLRAYRSWDTFQLGSDGRRWLFTICRNVFLRSKERERPQVDIADAEAEASAAIYAHTSAKQTGVVDALLTQIDLQPALKSALDALQEPFRSAVLLVDVEDQSYETAAQILDVPVGTVRSRLFRGRRLLQDALFDHARDLGYAVASANPPQHA